MIITIEDAANTLKDQAFNFTCSYKTAWEQYMHPLITDNFSFDEVLHYIEQGRPYMTTGEMLDTIDVGQIAERVYEPEGYCSDRYTKLKIDDGGDLLFYDEQDDNWEYDRLTGAMIRSQWRIIEED